MAFAVGTATADDLGAPPPAAVAASKDAPAAGAGGAAGAAGQTAAQIAANGGMREGGSGAGFYWHVVYLDF